MSAKPLPRDADHVLAEFQRINREAAADGWPLVDPGLTPWQQPVVGDRVLSRFKGGARWYSAKVMRQRTDKTFEISWEDGALVDKIKQPTELQVLEASGAVGSAPQRVSFRRGDQVLALAGCRSKCGPWYLAMVAEDKNTDGSYTVVWADGDRARGRNKYPEELSARQQVLGASHDDISVFLPRRRKPCRKVEQDAQFNGVTDGGGDG